MDENNGLVLYSGGGRQSKKVSTRLLPATLPYRLKIMVGEGIGVFEVPTATPIIIGRNSSKQTVAVDLTAFEATENGVSRQHLKIEIFGERLMVKDMDSVNGSRLNGATMTPNHVYDLQHGDELKIGRIKMRVFFVHN